MKHFALVVVGVSALVLAGCQDPGLRLRGPIPGAAVTQEGMIVFQAEGKSVVADPDDPLSLVKAEAAAAVLAKVNLLEIVKGCRLSSSVIISDLMYDSSEAEALVGGWLSRATVTIAERVGGRIAEPTLIVTATATIKLHKKDISRLMIPQATLIE